MNSGLVIEVQEVRDKLKSRSEAEFDAKSESEAEATCSEDSGSCCDLHLRCVVAEQGTLHLDLHCSLHHSY